MLIPSARFILLLGVSSVVHAAVPAHLESDSFAPQEHSSPCAIQNVTGIMQVLSTDLEQDIDFISCIFGRDSECYVIGDRSNANRVVLNPNCDSTEPFSVEIPFESPYSTNLFFGAAIFTFSNNPSGQAKNLSPDLYNWAKIEPTVHVPRGPAQDKRRRGLPKAIESTIWTLQNNTDVDNSDIMTLVPSWVNSDGSVASNVSLVFTPSERSLSLTGNVENLEERFGPASQVVTIRFIPDTNAPTV
ncbi:hypothetical protein C8Q70DRAFT_1038785 [Cubamyces menziesii]|nr:hypothetical protein C8Q70DRAFT_1038785 [Cubamyces menziesii]